MFSIMIFAVANFMMFNSNECICSVISLDFAVIANRHPLPLNAANPENNSVHNYLQDIYRHYFGTKFLVFYYYELPKWYANTHEVYRKFLVKM